jgi:multidrug efflux system membrane fusion protein
LKKILNNKKMKKIFLLPVLLFLFSCGDKEEPTDSEQEKSKAIPVKVATISVSTEALPMITSGKLSSKAETNLSFKIGGIVSQVFVDEGQRVRKGQLLAKLEQAEISNRVLQAKSGLEKLERDLGRIKNLYKDSVATLEQVQNLETALEVSKSDLKIAQFNQKYATIYAPSNGKVLKRYAERQELVGAGTPILTLASTSSAQVMRIGLADRDLVRLKLGDKAEIYFDAYPNTVFKAKVSELAEIADPRTGTFEVELELQSNQKSLKSGFVGKAHIYPSEKLSYYKIPMNALVEATNEQAFVFVPSADGKTAVKKSIQPETIGATFFTISANEKLKLEKVITDGNMYLLEGSEIEIRQQ